MEYLGYALVVVVFVLSAYMAGKLLIDYQIKKKEELMFKEDAVMLLIGDAIDATVDTLILDKKHGVRASDKVVASIVREVILS